MKTLLVALCLLLFGCKDNLSPVNTSIYYHQVTLVATSDGFQTTTVTYQVGTDNGSFPIGSKSFFNITPGTQILLTVTGSNAPVPPNGQQPVPGLVSASIFVDNLKWQSSNGGGQLNASATATGTIP